MYRRQRNYYRTFTEEPTIKRSFEAKKFIEDYGVDGEKLHEDNTTYLYEKSENKYQVKGPLRLYCKDCPKTKECKGREWDTCEHRIYLLTAINKYLAEENRGLEEDVKGYKELLGEKED